MKDLGQAFDRAQRIAAQVVGPLFSLAVMVLISVALLAAVGFPVRIVRTLPATELAYLAGAVWLWRKAAP